MLFKIRFGEKQTENEIWEFGSAMNRKGLATNEGITISD